MLLSGLFFTSVNVIVKHVGSALPAPEMVFLRYAGGVVFVLPMLPAILRTGFAPRLVGRFALRGLVHGIGVTLWFFSMARIPIAEVTAMSYLQPVYITLLAVMFLGERIALRRLAAIGCAILGMLIVLRPGFRELVPGHFAMLAAAPIFAISYTMAKSLTGLAPPSVVLGWMSLTVTLFLIPSATLAWVPPTTGAGGWLFLCACLATIGHYAMLRAFSAAPIIVTQPVTFLQLVWSVMFGALLFAEPVDGYVILGGTVILGSVMFIAWREARLRRARPVPAP